MAHLLLELGAGEILGDSESHVANTNEARSTLIWQIWMGSNGMGTGIVRRRGVVARCLILIGGRLHATEKAANSATEAAAAAFALSNTVQLTHLKCDV